MPEGLTALVALVASARVQPLIANEVSWSAIDAAAQAALTSGKSGTTVLLVD